MKTGASTASLLPCDHPSCRLYLYSWGEGLDHVRSGSFGDDSTDKGFKNIFWKWPEEKPGIVFLVQIWNKLNLITRICCMFPLFDNFRVFPFHRGNWRQSANTEFFMCVSVYHVFARGKPQEGLWSGARVRSFLRHLIWKSSKFLTTELSLQQ